MKKLTLFLFLVTAAAAPLFADWQTEAAKFKETARDVGYKAPAEFISFLDQAEGISAAKQTLFSSFTENPAAFLERSGIWLTVLLILLGGLALNLTPCVLPMIPVNIAIIGAGTQSGSRAKGFALGGMYGLGIASVYGLLGLVAVLGGKGFGALNASPWFNFGIAAIFLLLALSMFGVMHLDFSRFQTGRDGSRFKSKFAAAFAMGGVAALLAGACVAPVLLSVLLLAGTLHAQGSALGLILPFLLGLGMALPWPFAGAGLSFLPKPGIWMEWVKRGFGLLILLLALYYGKLGFSLLNRAATGNESQNLETELSAAYRAKQPVLLDFGAEWCKNCKQMDAETFPNGTVQQRLKKYRFVRVDATDPEQHPVAEIIKRFDVQGLPTFIVLSPAP